MSLQNLTGEAIKNETLPQAKTPLYLFDVSEENMTGSQETTHISGLEHYTFRTLALYAETPGTFLYNVESQDYVSSYLEYFRQVSGLETMIQTLGIPVVNNSLTQGALENLNELKKLNADYFLPFIMSENSEKIAKELNLPRLESYKASEAINDKSYFLEQCNKYNIDTPPGRSIQSSEQGIDLFYNLQAKGFKAFYAKYPRSASGEGIQQFYYDDPHCLENFQKYLESPNTTYNMQRLGVRMDGAIQFEESPAVVFWNCPYKGLQIISTNHQILCKKDRSDINPTIHKGSIGELSPQEIQNIDPILQRISHILRANNSYGPGSIDFISHTVNNQKKYTVVECNKRITGGYHAYLAKRFNVNHFYSDVNMYCPSSTSFNQVIGALESNNLLWNKNGKYGTFIINWQTVPHASKIAVLCLGENPHHTSSIHKATKEVLANLST